MNKYLIFRTDRIGDFLITAILIKSIKINDPYSHITIIASEKNYSYIKEFPYIDKVIQIKNNFFSKINLIFSLRKLQYKYIVVHDNKKRSLFISLFLSFKKRIVIASKKKLTHIEIIKDILQKMNFIFSEEALNTFEHKKNIIEKKRDIIQLHFDEKWIFKDYIKEYVNIEPEANELLMFAKKIKQKTGYNLIITSGLQPPKILYDILPDLKKVNINFYDNLDFLQLEKITLKSKILISCHGAISHVAAANYIKQIDIIDKSYNYKKWNHHFRNYFFYTEKNLLN